MMRFMSLLGVLMNADNGAEAAGGASPVEGSQPAAPVVKPRVSAAKLIEALQSSESIKEVSQKTGLTENNIHQRRHQLALKGVQLKQYAGSRGGNKLDVAKLQELAKSKLPDGAAVFVATTRATAPAAPETPSNEGAEAESTAAAS